VITEKDIATFVTQLRERLRVGATQYGDSSFRRPLEDVIGEVEQELLDTAGWGLIAWTRLQRLRERVARIERTEQGGADGRI
jgi:hypothetical protein